MSKQLEQATHRSFHSPLYHLTTMHFPSPFSDLYKRMNDPARLVGGRGGGAGMGSAEDPRGYLTAALGDDGGLPAPPAATRRRIVVVRDDCHDTGPNAPGAVEVGAGAGGRAAERASSTLPQAVAANSSASASDPVASGAARLGSGSGSGSSALLVALREFEAALTDPFQLTGGPDDTHTDIDNNDAEADAEGDRSTNAETDVLDSMMRSEHWHGSGRGVQLEVQFQGEAGTGTGPTAEFLSIVSREFVAPSVTLWRSSSGGGGGGGDSSDDRATALFPVSLPVLHAANHDAVEESWPTARKGAWAEEGVEESRAAWISHGCKLFGVLGWLVMQAVQVSS